MSKLKELIAKYCPNGVEYKPLGNILDYEQPTPYIVKRAEYDASYSVPVLTAGQSFILGYTNEQDGIYRANKDNPTIIFDDFTTSFHWVDFDFKVKSSAMKMLRPNPTFDGSFKYIFYAMECIHFEAVNHTRHWISKYSQFEIPLPPLQVQEEIVRILDTFCALSAELQAELQARKEQYEYYRNLLLSFRSTFGAADEKQKNELTITPPSSYKIQWLPMGEICVNICSGGTPSTAIKEYYHGNIPWLRTQEVDWNEIYDTEIKISEDAILNSSAKLIPINCVIVAMYGATAAKSCINKIPLTTNQACCNLQIDESIATYKYVYHYLCNEYKNLKALGEGSQSNINAKKIKSYLVPVPPIDVQQEIVRILDKFDALVSDLTAGLPAEIAAVQEQYEYYRNSLLSFTPADARAVRPYKQN